MNGFFVVQGLRMRSSRGHHGRFSPAYAMMKNRSETASHCGLVMAEVNRPGSQLAEPRVKRSIDAVYKFDHRTTVALLRSARLSVQPTVSETGRPTPRATGDGRLAKATMRPRLAGIGAHRLDWRVRRLQVDAFVFGDHLRAVQQHDRTELH